MRLAILFLVLTACDDTIPPEEASASARYVAGLRLHTRVLVGADGSEKFIGFWDDLAGIPCDAAIAPDGQVRCMPDEAILATRDAYRKNANCTGPLAGFDGVRAPAGVAPNNTVSDYHIIGPEYTGQVYLDAGIAGCIQAGGPLFPITWDRLFEIGTAIPSSAFVPFTVQIRP